MPSPYCNLARLDLRLGGTVKTLLAMALLAIALVACGGGGGGGGGENKTYQGWTPAQFESAVSEQYAESRGLYSEATIRCGFEIIAGDYTYVDYAADTIPLDVAMQTLVKCQ